MNLTKTIAGYERVDWLYMDEPGCMEPTGEAQSRCSWFLTEHKRAAHAMASKESFTG